MGVPCDMDAINSLSAKYNIPVVEDAACGFGSEYKGVRIGNSRNLVTYSLQARKCLTTGEGGFVIARDEKEAEWFKSYRAFGTSVSPLERDKASFLLKEQFAMLGTNHKISDITAAVGLAQLKTFDEEVVLRDQAGKIYNKLVQGRLKDYATIANKVPEYCTRYNWQNYHIILHEHFDRDVVVDALRKKGIGCKWDIQCIHLEPLFRNRYNDLDLSFSKRFHDNGLWLPFFAEITLEEQEYVIDTLKEVLDGLK
jgi:dTDP-4-amino-4,6-dideoxygalactose transaminase